MTAGRGLERAPVVAEPSLRGGVLNAWQVDHARAQAVSTPENRAFPPSEDSVPWLPLVWFGLLPIEIRCSGSSLQGATELLLPALRAEDVTQSVSLTRTAWVAWAKAQAAPLVLGDERTLDKRVDSALSALGIVRTYEVSDCRSALMRRHDGDKRRRPLHEIVEHRRGRAGVGLRSILAAGMRCVDVRLEPVRHIRHVLASSCLANGSHTLAPSPLYLIIGSPS